jgi:hypothetical protein
VKTLKVIRNLADEVPERVEQLGAGVQRANQTMTILAVVAVVALMISTVALLRVQAVSRGIR